MFVWSALVLPQRLGLLTAVSRLAGKASEDTP